MVSPRPKLRTTKTAKNVLRVVLTETSVVGTNYSSFPSGFSNVWTVFSFLGKHTLQTTTATRETARPAQEEPTWRMGATLRLFFPSDGFGTHLITTIFRF
jgi:hypothetical protein